MTQDAREGFCSGSPPYAFAKSGDYAQRVNCSNSAVLQQVKCDQCTSVNLLPNMGYPSSVGSYLYTFNRDDNPGVSSAAGLSGQNSLALAIVAVLVMIGVWA